MFNFKSVASALGVGKGGGDSAKEPVPTLARRPKEPQPAWSTLGRMEPRINENVHLLDFEDQDRSDEEKEALTRKYKAGRRQALTSGK